MSPGVGAMTEEIVEGENPPNGDGVSHDDGPAAAPTEAQGEETSVAVDSRAGFGVWAASHFVSLILGLVSVVLALVLILTLLALGNQHALDGARSSALTEARTYTVEVASYDYRHLTHDFAVVAANCTPTFRHSYLQSSGALKSTLTQFHATATATVVAAGVVSATTDRAVALVFLDQRITNTSQTTPTTDRSEIEITLVHQQGRWLIDQITDL
jgi:Mce-associated membrane protein